MLQPQFNRYPKPTNWASVYILMQQAFENGFRGATAAEFAEYLAPLISLTANGAPRSVLPTFNFSSATPGIYIPEENGTYNGVSVSLSDGVNYLVWDGSSLTKVVFPVNLSGYATIDELKTIYTDSVPLDTGANIPGRYTNIGSMDTNASYSRTDFIEVDSSWIFNRSSAQSANTVSLMFDEFKTPIGIMQYTAGVDFMVKPRTKYVIFSKLGTTGGFGVTVKKAISVPMSEKTKEISERDSESATDNYFHPSKLILGSPGTTWDASGNIINNAAGLRVTELIKIRENNSGTLAVGRIFNTINPWRFAWYDANGVFITSTPMSDTDGNSIVDRRHGRWGWADIPEGAVYFRLRIDFRSENTQDQIDQIQVIDRAAWPIINYRSTYSTKVTSDDVRRIIKAEKVIDTDLSQKSILTLGDSISANLAGDGSWHIWFDSSLRPKIRYTQASGGATLTSNYAGFGPDYLNDGNTFMRQCERAVQNIANGSYQIPDVIFIMGGTNDFNNTSPNAFVTPTELGSTPYDEYMEGMFMTVSPDYNTLKPLTDVPRNKVAGALRYIVERLGAVAPQSVFFVCTPIQSTLHNQLNAQRVVRDIKWMANRLNLPLIDCWNAAGMTMLWDYGTDRKLLGDRVHPFTDSGQTAGSPIMGRFIVSEFLKKYIPIVATNA